MTPEQRAREINLDILRQQHDGGSCCYPSICWVLPLLDAIAERDQEIVFLAEDSRDAYQRLTEEEKNNQALYAQLDALVEVLRKHHETAGHGERGPCVFEGSETEPCPTTRAALAAGKGE